jgi:hypothetical protein
VAAAGTAEFRTGGGSECIAAQLPATVIDTRAPDRAGAQAQGASVPAHVPDDAAAVKSGTSAAAMSTAA